MEALLKRLEIRHLRLVQAIAGSGSLSAAATGLHLTQSALSHQLKVLEETLAVSLFHRHGKKMVITPTGQRVLAAAEKILHELGDMHSDLNNLKRGTDVCIRLATECYTSFHWLPRVIPLYRQTHPNVRINLEPEIDNNLTAQLTAGELDIAIRMSAANDKFDSHLLFNDDIVVLMSPNHPLAQSQSIQPAQLLEQHLMLYHSGKNRLLRALFNEAQISKLNVTEMPLTEAILEWCSANLGITIMARWAAKRWLDTGDVVLRPLQVPWAQRHWHAVTLKQELPAYLQDFIDLLKANPPENPQ
ncbi:MAG: LysR family transcriptional regulator [Oceanospirillaceae bacterium]|nr:LysR family transcriptional regulator [Oceanospirillaceae bacterium]